MADSTNRFTFVSFQAANNKEGKMLWKLSTEFSYDTCTFDAVSE